MPLNVKQILRWGTGCGIEIRGGDLRVAAVRSRNAGVQVAGYGEIARFRERPPSEWGAEHHAFLEGLHLSHLSATVTLPRDEVIVREIVIPPVSKKELSTAVGYQLENLHPFDPDEIYSAFAPLRPIGKQTASLPLVVVIAEKTKVDAYADLFEAAGIAVESFTVAAAAFFTGARVRWDKPPVPFVMADFTADGVEMYGEGIQRPLLSSWFDTNRVPPSRVFHLAGAGLRLEGDQAAKWIRVGEARENSDGAVELPECFEPHRVEDLLPSPIDAPGGFDAANAAAAYAAGLDAACPRLGWGANLLPAARRKKNSRWMYGPTAALAAACLLLALAFPLRGWLQDGSYLRAIEAETKRLSAAAEEVNALEAQARENQEKYAVLEALDKRAGADLEILRELSDLLPETVWLNSLEMDDDGVRIQGIADRAAPLLGMINEAVNVAEVEFSASIVTTKEGLEKFRMTAKRRSTRETSGLAASTPESADDGGALSRLGDEASAPSE